MKNEDCSICSSEHKQIRVLLTHLRTRVIKQSNQYVPNYQEAQHKDNNTDAFSRLLVLIFGHKSTTSQPTFIHCSHTKFTRYFRRKLKCDNQTFNVLCSEIASKLAERNYQFEIMNLQFASVVETALTEATHPKAENIAKMVAQDKQERRKRQLVTTSMLPQVQEEEREVPNIQNTGSGTGMGGYWVGQPPLMHFPWMFPGAHERN